MWGFANPLGAPLSLGGGRLAPRYPCSMMLAEPLISEDGRLLDVDRRPLASESCYTSNHWLGDNGDTLGIIHYLRRKELIARIHTKVQFAQCLSQH